MVMIFLKSLRLKKVYMIYDYYDVQQLDLEKLSKIKFKILDVNTKWGKNCNREDNKTAL